MNCSKRAPSFGIVLRCCMVSPQEGHIRTGVLSGSTSPMPCSVSAVRTLAASFMRLALPASSPSKKTRCPSRSGTGEIRATADGRPAAITKSFLARARSGLPSTGATFLDQGAAVSPSARRFSHHKYSVRRHNAKERVRPVRNEDHGAEQPGPVTGLPPCHHA
jgi:hypothetical protein